MSAVSDLERLSALIDFVYRGATEPALWPEIVAAASVWLESPKGMIYTPLHGPEQKGIYFPHGLSDDFFELYKTRYQSVDMWTEQVVQRKLFTEGNVILGTDLVPHDTLMKAVIQVHTLLELRGSIPIFTHLTIVYLIQGMN